MSFGIRVSKPGVNVNTAGAKDLFMDTNYPILKIKQSGTGSLSVSDGSSDTDTIAHNLGYIPKVFVYGQTYSANGSVKNSDYRSYPYLETLMSGTLLSNFEYSLDTTNLYIYGAFSDGSSNSDTFSYFYYLFYDE